jgi:hypothetical protein
MIIQKYINLYYNKSITKCVANAIQASRLFLGVRSKTRSYLLATALPTINLELFDLVRKRLVDITQWCHKYYYLADQYYLRN